MISKKVLVRRDSPDCGQRAQVISSFNKEERGSGTCLAKPSKRLTFIVSLVQLIKLLIKQ